MTNNTPVEHPTNHNSPCKESVTLYEPNHLPAEPPYHRPPEPKETGDESEGWVLTIYEPYCLPLAPDTP